MARRMNIKRAFFWLKSRPCESGPITVGTRKRPFTLVADQHGIYRVPLGVFRAIEHHFPKTLAASIPAVDYRQIIHVVVNLNERDAIVFCRADSQLKAWLEQAGFHVKLVLQPIGPHLTTIDPAHQFDQLIDPKWSVPERLTHVRSGQFEVRSPHDVRKLTLALASAFPKAPCVIPFASSEEAVEFQRQLQMLTPEPVTMMRGRFRHPQSRITVCTFEAARHGEYGDSPLYIVPRWPGSFHQRLKSLARHPHVERLFLIRTETNRISEADETELLLRVGPLLWLQRLDVPRAQHVFHIVRFGGDRPPNEERCTAPLDKRRSYWRHRGRNQLLAGIAHQLVCHDDNDADGRPYVALLVETTEHANKLAGILPGWPVITQDNLPTALPPFSIVTLTAASKVACFAPHYLVNGCGGPASPWIESWLERQSLAGNAIRIADLSDTFSEQAAILSQGRQVSYRRAGAVWRPLASHILKPALESLKVSTGFRCYVPPR